MQHDPKSTTWEDVAALAQNVASSINYHDRQELFEEAQVAFCLAYATHDPAKAKFTTWLSILARRRLLTWTRPFRNRPYMLLDSVAGKDTLIPSGPDEARKDARYKIPQPKDDDGHWTDGLSADAEIVLDLCLDPPDEVLEAVGEKRHGCRIRKAVRLHLLKCGWGKDRVEKAFDEVKEAMS